MKPHAHLDAIRLRLINSPVVSQVAVIRTQDFGDKSYFEPGSHLPTTVFRRDAQVDGDAQYARQAGGSF